MFLSITLISLGHISFARLSWPWLCISRQHSRSLRFSFGCRHDLHSLLRYGIATRIGRKSARRRRCRRNWISGAPLGQWLRPNSCQRGAHCRLTKGGRDARPTAGRRLALLSGARGLSGWSTNRKLLAQVLTDKYAEFEVHGQVTQINPGPVVTTFEYKPEAGIKYSRITNLTDDLCLALKAESILIERMAGKSTVGIQVPNRER